MDKKAIWGYLGLFVAAFILRERCGASRLPTRRSFLLLRGTLGLRPDSLTLRVQQFNILG